MLTISRESFEKDTKKIFAHIEQTGEEVIVTVGNVPFVKIVPMKSDVESIFKDIRGRVKYREDILKPETEEWGDAL